MKNYADAGGTFTGTAPYAVASGGGCLIGSIFGMAQSDAASGATVVLVRGGRFVGVPKTNAQEWTVGAKVYWDNTNKVFTTAASGNTLVGVAAAAAANPSATGDVLLTGQIS